MKPVPKQLTEAQRLHIAYGSTPTNDLVRDYGVTPRYVSKLRANKPLAWSKEELEDMGPGLFPADEKSRLMRAAQSAPTRRQTEHQKGAQKYLSKEVQNMYPKVPGSYLPTGGAFSPSKCDRCSTHLKVGESYVAMKLGGDIAATCEPCWDTFSVRERPEDHAWLRR